MDKTTIVIVDYKIVSDKTSLAIFYQYLFDEFISNDINIIILCNNSTDIIYSIICDFDRTISIYKTVYKNSDIFIGDMFGIDSVNDTFFINCINEKMIPILHTVWSNRYDQIFSDLDKIKDSIIDTLSAYYEVSIDRYDRL